jgi:RNA polymerase sigma factor (sigma-70 family)
LILKAPVTRTPEPPPLYIDTHEEADLGIEAVMVADAPPAIDELLAEHGSVLLAAARLICLNEQEAQDVVQTTFEIALRRGHTLRDRGALRAWLLTIEAREATRRVRQMRSLIPFRSEIHDVPVSGPSQDERLALRESLRALPRGARAAIVLHYLAGYSVRETAKAMRVTENTIKTQLQRGLARLREDLCDE